MKKINFNMNISNLNIDEIKKEIAAKLYKERIVIEKMDELGLTKEEVDKNPFTMKDYFQGAIICSKCKDITECEQATNGYRIDITKDLEITYKPCRKLITKSNDTKYMNNFIVNYMHSGQEKIEIKEINLENESVEYQNMFLQVYRKIEKENNKGLYLYGDFGVGKTYLLCAIANYYVKKNKTVGFIDLGRWVADLKKMMSVTNENFSEMISKVSKLDILIFDDIGTNNNTAWVRDEIVFPIINYRSANNLPIWFSSNLSQEEIAELYGNLKDTTYAEISTKRFLDRLLLVSEEVYVKGINRRHIK